MFFGERASPLFGVFHPPAAPVRARRAVLLCNPFGEEAIRAFRTYKLLADRLARGGLPTLRFDYPSTGDSAGACENVSLAQFSDSVLTAHDELVDMTDASQVIWVGLRFGALVAGQAVADAPSSLKTIIAWDPVFDGRAYGEELRAGHRTAMEAMGLPRTDDAEALGFAVPPAFEKEMAEADPISVIEKAGVSGMVVGQTDFTPGGWSSVDDPEPGLWNSDKAMNAYVVPLNTIEVLAEKVESL